MKRTSFIAFIALLVLVLGTTSIWSQQPSGEYVVLNSQDSIFGRTQLKYAKAEKKKFLRVVSNTGERDFEMDEVTAFRTNGCSYIMKPLLHPNEPVPYYRIIENGSISLFAQLCENCPHYHNVHAELEDGSIVCMNKKNYHRQLLPQLIKSNEFKEAVKHKSVRYPFFQNLATRRVMKLVKLYNNIQQTEGLE